MENLFYGCKSLISLNLYNFTFENVSDFTNIFYGSYPYLSLCINTSKALKISQYIQSIKINCSNICFQNNNHKIIIEKNICVDNCTEDPIYKFDYKDVCYEICLNKNHNFSETGHLCEREEEIIYDIISDNIIISDSIFTDIITTGELNALKEIILDNNLPKDEIILNLKKALESGSMDTLLENVISGDKKDIIIQDEGIVYQITTTDNQKYNVHYNISSISLGECEDILRFQYKINKTTPLIVLKIEIYPEGISIPMIEYEVYDSSINKQLDLDKCKGVKMDIILPVDIDYKNVFKYNMSSEYYNDICETFTTESGTDITIADRKKEFNKNKNKMSICEEKCELTGYNSTTKSAKCECQVKSKLSSVSDIIENKDKILNDFMDIKNKTNFQILKYYNKLFTKQGIEKNIGNYILLSIILIHIICLIRFIFPEYKR